MRHIQAKNFTPVAHRSIDLIVMHKMELPEGAKTAEECANFFKNQPKSSKTGTSAHYCGDENSIVNSVWDHDVAWAAPGANHNGLHFELAGFSKQKDWEHEDTLAMLEIVAEVVARKAHIYDIRPRKIGPADIRAGRSGICGHIDVTHAYPDLGSHTDPGTAFPWPHFMHRVHHYFGLHRSS